MPSDDLSAVQAGVDVKVMLTHRLAEALGEDSDIVDFDDLCDRIKAERGQAASCHVFECRNDRTADSPYCPAHTQITELLAAAPFPPVDREALLAILADTYGMEGHPDHEHAADALISAGVVRTPGPELDREALGRLVREVWIGWAREQPNPKPSWLVPWEDLSEPDREVDRRIGETLARVGISAGVVAQPPAWWKGQEIEWNSTGDTWQPGVIIAPLAPVVALIRLHDNGQRLNVETRHLRARGSSREAGQP